jgi:hypothetical protein
MKIYWSPPLNSALEAFPEADRRRIWKECSKEGFRSRKSWVGLPLCGLYAGVGSLIGDVVGIGIWGATIGGAVGGFLASQFFIQATLEVIQTRKYS